MPTSHLVFFRPRDTPGNDNSATRLLMPRLSPALSDRATTEPQEHAKYRRSSNCIISATRREDCGGNRATGTGRVLSARRISIALITPRGEKGEQVYWFRIAGNFRIEKINVRPLPDARVARPSRNSVSNSFLLRESASSASVFSEPPRLSEKLVHCAHSSFGKSYS